MAKPQYNYDDPEDRFYKKIGELASSGFNDREIADLLDLTEANFNKMKNGKYECWNDEQNAARSELIKQVLTRRRQQIVGALRGTYIRAALGQVKPKSKTIKYVEERCTCGGVEDCPICGGLGRVVRSDKWVTIETEAETAPNMQAIATLLYHYDKDWRKVERRLDDDASEVPENVQHGVPIEKWINGCFEGGEGENEGND